MVFNRKIMELSNIYLAASKPEQISDENASIYKKNVSLEILKTTWRLSTGNISVANLKSLGL